MEEIQQEIIFDELCLDKSIIIQNNLTGNVYGSWITVLNRTKVQHFVYSCSVMYITGTRHVQPWPSPWLLQLPAALQHHGSGSSLPSGAAPGTQPLQPPNTGLQLALSELNL